MKMKFTNRALADIVSDPDKAIKVWDESSQGLGLRVTPGGVKSFVFRQERNGRQMWVTIGRFNDWTVEEARAKVAELRKAVSEGKAPALAMRPAKGITVNDAAERMMAEHSPHLRPRTVRRYRECIDNGIAPALGKLHIAALAPSDVAALHSKLKRTPRSANMVLGVLSIICKYAEKWGERPLGSNPCQHQSKYPEVARHRYLDENEIAAIGHALNKLAERFGDAAIDALRLIMLTGGRKGEILNLRWEQVDLGNARLSFAPSEHKTGGSAIAKTVPIGAAAVDLLKSRPRASEYVFPSPLGGPLADIKRLWEAVRVEANVPDVRIHDLRHTWGAVATSGGHALQTIGAVMGHRNPSTTARYAHVAPSPAARAVEETSAKIAAAMGKSKLK